MEVKAICANCKSRGKLFKRNQKQEVVLVPTDSVRLYQEEEQEESKRYKNTFLKSHGSATMKQKINFVILGSCFWVAVMLIANYISMEKSRFKPGVGSYCVAEYKKCATEFDWNLCASSMYDCGDIENENYGSFIFTSPEKLPEFHHVENISRNFSYAQNKANENVCLYTARVSNNICENLCFAADFSYDSDENFEFIAPEFKLTSGRQRTRYNHQKNEECKSICMLASDMEVQEDCPFQKRCPNGCPCPGYKCSEDVLDFNLAGVDLVQKSFVESNLYKISLESTTVKFEQLCLSNNLKNFCIVQYHADFYLLQEADAFGVGDHKLTLHRIDKDGKIVLMSEDFVTVQILFGRAKICGRGIYQNEEERIIFCSSFESRGICHSYAINGENIILTEIYNRPQSTLNPSFSKYTDVFGMTFNNQLTTIQMHESYHSVSITSFAGREKSGNHLWTHQQVNFPTSYRDDTFTGAELDGTIQLISVFSDNEGIIFVTETENLYSNLYEESTIRFHRIYRNNWFFLGRYTFWRKNLVINFTAGLGNLSIESRLGDRFSG